MALTMNKETILEAKGLHAWYGSSHVLHGVDLDVRKGETVGLLGRNGMGKSTLIRTLLGHVGQRDGHISLFGRDISRARPHEVARQGVAYVPEGRGIFGNLTVRENLVAFGDNRNGAREPWTLEGVYDLFPQLRDRAQHLGGQLSGGEQQMVAIGRALMTNPHLLVLDEATEGLAPRIRETIWDCLARLRDRGQAILVIDKYVRRLLPLADRHTLVERGRAVWAGDSPALAADPGLWERYIGV